MTDDYVWYDGGSMNRIVVQITPGTVILTLFFLFVAWLLYEIRDIIPIIISAVVFSLALAPGKRFLARFKIPEPIAVVLLYLFVFLTFIFFIYSLLPVIAQQYSVFVETLPNIVGVLRDFFQGTVFEGVITDQFISAFSNSQQITQTVQGLFKVTTSGIFSVFDGIVNVTLFLLLTFLFAARPKSLDNFLQVMTPPKYQAYVDDLWHRSKIKMSQWFQGQMLLVFIIAVLTYLALLIIGVPNALFLALFAGVMEIIPLFGPVIGSIPAVLMALTTGDLTAAVLVIVVFILIQQIENNLIYPLVVTKVVGVSSILVILAVVIGGSIAGFIGIVIAVPLVGVMQEFFTDVEGGKLRTLRESPE